MMKNPNNKMRVLDDNIVVMSSHRAQLLEVLHGISGRVVKGSINMT